MHTQWLVGLQFVLLFEVLNKIVFFLLNSLCLLTYLLFFHRSLVFIHCVLLVLVIFKCHFPSVSLCFLSPFPYGFADFIFHCIMLLCGAIEMFPSILNIVLLNHTKDAFQIPSK